MSTLLEPNRAAVMQLWEQVHAAMEQRLGEPIAPLRQLVDAIIATGLLNNPAKADLEAFFADMIAASVGDGAPPVLPAVVTRNETRTQRILQALAAGR